VERITQDSVEYLSLSPAGVIFHETLKDRFARNKAQLLPPDVPAAEKKPPRFEDAGWPGQYPALKQLCEAITREIPFVVRVQTRYFNPDLSKQTAFRLGAEGIELCWSDGTACAKLLVTTRAENENQKKAAVAALNQWLHKH